MYFKGNRETEGYQYTLPAICSGSEDALNKLSKQVSPNNLYVMLASINEKNQLIVKQNERIGEGSFHTIHWK